MRGMECVYSGGISVALAAALWQGLAVVAYHACPAMWLCMLLVEAQGLTATVFEALGMWPELCHSCDSCCLIPKTATGCGSLIRAIVLEPYEVAAHQQGRLQQLGEPWQELEPIAAARVDSSCSAAGAKEAALATAATALSGLWLCSSSTSCDSGAAAALSACKFEAAGGH